MPSAASSWICSQKSRRAFGSTPAVGSSSSSSCGRVQHAGGERQPLLPAAGQRAGELRAARRRGPAAQASRSIASLARPATPYIRATKSRFSLDRQILVQAEALRHVADLALDRRRSRARRSKPRQVPSPSSGVSKPHSMRIVVVLPLPFGPRNPKICPALDANGEPVDDGAAVVALGETVHVDRRRGRTGHLASSARARASARSGEREPRSGRRRQGHRRAHRAGVASMASTGNPGCSAGFGASGHASTR